MSCDPGSQVHLHVSRRRYHDHARWNHRTPQQTLLTDATDGKAATAAAALGDILANVPPAHSDTEPKVIRRRGEDYPDEDYSKDYDDPGDAHLHTSGGPPYNGSSYTSSASYTASGNYSATATSLTPSGTSTSVRNGTSSASGNGTSTIVVTSTATATSVQTVTSVSTDIETMVTTVTGPDSTEIYTTTCVSQFSSPQSWCIDYPAAHLVKR